MVLERSKINAGTEMPIDRATAESFGAIWVE